MRRQNVSILFAVFALIFAPSYVTGTRDESNYDEEEELRNDGSHEPSAELFLPDIYYVSDKQNFNHFPETTVDGITYKQVDISDDIMRFGLNRNIHLEDYLENKKKMKLVVKDLEDVAPFGYEVAPKRRVIFVVDNKRVRRYFTKERKNVLQLALTIDPDDDAVAHAFYYRLSSVLDNDEKKRHSFLHRVIKNLARNRVLPRDLTVAQIETNLTDAQILEYMRRSAGLRPFVEAEVDRRTGIRYFPKSLMGSAASDSVADSPPRRRTLTKRTKTTTTTKRPERIVASHLR